MECSPSDDLLRTLRSGEIPEGERIRGGTRQVIIPESDPDCVAKFDDDARQNEDEIQSIDRYPQMTDLWIDIKRSGDNWIIEDRADREANQSEVQDIKEEIDSRDWMCIDLHKDNVMVEDGDPVIVDFESCRPKKHARDWMLEKWDQNH